MMLIARAASVAIVAIEMIACTIVSTFAQRLSTGVSVGEISVTIGWKLRVFATPVRGNELSCVHDV